MEKPNGHLNMQHLSLTLENVAVITKYKETEIASAKEMPKLNMIYL